MKLLKLNELLEDIQERLICKHNKRLKVQNKMESFEVKNESNSF